MGPTPSMLSHKLSQKHTNTNMNKKGMHADEDTQAHWLVVARSVRGPTAAVAQYHKKMGTDPANSKLL